MIRRARSALLPLALPALLACSSKVPHVTAKQITSRADLVGGPGALGEVGDYLLANEQIRVVVQGPGYSRGFGLYGGSLIDVDLQRPSSAGSSAGGEGRDNFSELFPAIFLKAMKPLENGISVRQLDDGSGGAVLTITGRPDEFLFVAERINDLLVDSEKLYFQNEYKLLPGKRYIEITTTVINRGTSTVEIPGQGITQLSEMLNGFTLPVGDVILFGAGNDVFSEGAGFDMRFTLEALYKETPPLPKLPGLVTPFLATRGEGISYGFMSGITDPALSFVSRTGYTGAPVDSLVIPFIAASFTGAFYGAAPATLEAGASFSFKKYFIVGDGDVASIRDVVHQLWAEKRVDLRPQVFGTFSGRVRDARTQAPEEGVAVVTFDATGSPYNQHTPDSTGSFRGSYAPGRYTYRVVSAGRFTTDPVEFVVAENEPTYAEIQLPEPGMVSVRILDTDGRLLPARCTLVGRFDEANAGLDPKSFLYDLSVGEAMRPTDLIPDTSDPATREFVEHVILAPGGQKAEHVRPGKYRAVCSRGMEYDISTEDVEVRPGEVTQLQATLARAIDTTGWASGDYHLHADPSVDSSMPLEDRIAHCATEGLDVACSSDHNFVTDYAPVIAGLGLESWLQGMVGLEMTTLEIGHFNAFPLSYDPGPVTKGSFEWSGRKPADLFEDLRCLGSFGPDNTIIQVNHPRDTILGYFNNYNFDQDTGEPEDSQDLLVPVADACTETGEPPPPPNPRCSAPSGGPSAPHCEFGKTRFALDFDAIEIFNGKRFELLHTYRVPEVLPPPPLPDNIPPAGSVLRDEDGNVAFPGGLEDWFTMLNRGQVYTAMANSDSHSAEDEPGLPRTYVPVTRDQPGAIDELELIAGLKSQRAMLTNGPFIRISAAGNGTCRTRGGTDLGVSSCGMGEVVQAANGGISVSVSIDTAPWISIDTVRFYESGEVVRTVAGDNPTLASLTETIPVRGDGWVIVEVQGSKSMWPVIVPYEVPSLQISDALGSIGGAFGVSFNPFGNLSPERLTVTYAYAFTNPIFIDGDGDGRWVAPGLSRQALTAATEPRVRGKRSTGHELPLLVKMFGAFAGHGHH